MAAVGACWQDPSWATTGGWAAGVWAGSATRGGTSWNRLRVILMRLKKRREQQRAALKRRR